MIRFHYVCSSIVQCHIKKNNIYSLPNINAFSFNPEALPIINTIPDHIISCLASLSFTSTAHKLIMPWPRAVLENNNNKNKIKKKNKDMNKN